MSEKPEFPPMRVEVMVPFWHQCFWMGHAMRWRLSEGGRWIQERCLHCAATGSTEPLVKPEPPPPPPPPKWRNPHE